MWHWQLWETLLHYNDAIMSAMTSQITSLTIAYSAVYSRRTSQKHQSSASLAFVSGIYRWPVNSPHKWPVMRQMFLFDDAIMNYDDLVVGLCQSRERQLDNKCVDQWFCHIKPIHVISNYKTFSHITWCFEIISSKWGKHKNNIWTKWYGFFRITEYCISSQL